jgi:hypothetical protein
MWVLVLIALNLHLIVTIPGYSSEQTCFAGGKEVSATLEQAKRHSRWHPHCFKVG